MIQCSVTGKFFSEFFWSGLDRRDLESPATHQELFPGNPGEISGFGLRDHSCLIPLQSRRKSQLPRELGRTQPPRAERRFWEVYFYVYGEALAHPGLHVTDYLVSWLGGGLFNCSIVGRG